MGRLFTQNPGIPIYLETRVKRIATGPKYVRRRLPDEDFEVVAPIDLEPEQLAPERPLTGSRWKETTTTVFTPYDPNLPKG